jgi:hypothetical protein
LDVSKMFTSSLEEWSPIIERVTDLFLRMPTRQAEVAATVYFVALSLKHSGDQRPTEVEVLDHVKQWKQKRRPPLEDKEVGQTIRNLNMLSWVDLRVSSDLPLQEGQQLYV